MSTLFNDIKHAIRGLRKNPGFTAVAMLTLSLGIGVNLALFGILNEMVLRPKPVDRPDELWAVVPADAAGQRRFARVYRPLYDAIRRDGRPFHDVIAYAPITPKLRTQEGSEALRVELVAGDYFSVLGVVPVLGRAFLPEEDRQAGRAAVAVISHAFWRNQYGGMKDVLGKTVTLNDTLIEIVGVAPPGFVGLDYFHSPILWIPVNMETVLETKSVGYQIVGRLTEPKLAKTVEDILSPIAAKITQGLLNSEYPELSPSGVMLEFTRIRLEPVGQGLLGTSRMKPKIVRFLQFAGVATVLLLLIACANVAGLFLARAMQGRKETATRIALGATRLDLIRQTLCEGVLIAAGGTIGALLAFSWVSRTIMTFVSWWPGTPLSLVPDLRVLLFAAGGVLAVGVGFSILPALQSSRLDPYTALKETQGASRKRLWLRHGMIVLQMVGSLILLCGATLCLRSMSKQLAVDLGYRHDRLAIVPLDLERIGFTTETFAPQLTEIVRRVSLVPGVEQVSVSPFQPLVSGIGVMDTENFRPEGYNGKDTNFAFYRNIGPGLFSLMGIPILRGREFNQEDIELNRNGIIVNERFARLFWPDQNPLGKHVYRWEVIGVVKDVSLLVHDDWLDAGLYRVATQRSFLHTSLLIRSAGDARRVLALVRAELGRIHPRLIDGKARTLRDVLKSDLAFQHTATRILLTLGGLALVLAAVGIYGVMAYVVNSRTREIGIRLAFGATRADAMKLILSTGFRLGLVALVIGLPIALGLATVFRSQIEGISPFDPLSYIAAAASVLGALITACWLPASRAAKIDPAAALRYE
ncbi:MAG: ABC transporter permease [Planctomycetes bacterium]|nr:ABC transporter permease [Planctomycetota bacterium]